MQFGYQDLGVLISCTKRHFVWDQLATVDNVLASHRFQNRTERKAEEASLFGIGLPGRTFSDVESNRSRGTRDLRLEIVLLSFRQLRGDLIHQINVLQRQPPNFKLLKL